MTLLKRNMPNERLIHFTFSQGINPVEKVEFHTEDNDRLIINGIYSHVETSDTLYIDCEPVVNENTEWIEPVKVGNVLKIKQVYSAVKNGNVLEIR